MSIREFIVLFVVCLLWGLHFIVMKVTIGGTADPLFYAALRMSLVAIIMLPWLKWHKSLMLPIIGAGLGYGALNYAFMFPALGMTTASAAAITIELYVPFSIILSVIVFKDKIGFYKLIGILLAFIGVIIIAAAKPDETAGPYFILGILLMVGAAMSEAIGAVLVKFVKNVGPLQLLAWFAVIGSCVLWPLSLLLEDKQLDAFAPENRTAFILALAYSALLVSIVAHGSYYWLLQRLPIYIVSSTGLMTTVIAVMASALILGEALTPHLIIGGLVTLGGIGLILARKKQSADTAPLPLP
ncbi:DMT family transporter [Hellea sp.]|nr:DMT family transporter [Hellea sp.]